MGCVWGLVLIAGVYINPCHVEVMRQYRQKEDTCSVIILKDKHRYGAMIPTTCDEVYKALIFKVKRGKS